VSVFRDFLVDNMKKITKMNELAWLLGLVICPLGISLCTKADFGLSMIAAPPYILHLGLRDIFPWFTQGTAEYVWQAVILVIICIAVHGFKPRYLLSFGTAFLSGLCLDGWLTVLGGNGVYETMPQRIIAFAAGTLISAFAIALYFRTSLPAQIYELAVSEISSCYKWNQNKVKLVNDGIMFAISVIFALVITGGLHGIGVGTVVITIVNAPLIAMFGKILDRFFEFDHRFHNFFKKK